MSIPEESNQWTLEPLGMRSPRRFVATVRSQVISGLIAGHQVEEKLLRRESPASKEKGRKAVSSLTQVERRDPQRDRKEEAKEVERPPKAKTKAKERAAKVKEKPWAMSRLRRSQKLRSRPGPGMPVDGKVMMTPVGTTGLKAVRAHAWRVPLGALHGSAMVTKRHERAIETRSGLSSKSVIAAI